MSGRAAQIHAKIRNAEFSLRAEKLSVRRDELADAALETLGALGYARTSLREIAQNTIYTHGLFHYYFKDKNALIAYCVRRYKATCVKRYDDAVAEAKTPKALLDAFCAALTTTLREDCSMHRLWYDLRAQALFETTFREDVVEIDCMLERMIWRIAERHAQLAARKPALSSSALYAMMDGLFQRALLMQAVGHEECAAALAKETKNLFTRFC
jgi:AcrR family transcriptional regulator